MFPNKTNFPATERRDTPYEYVYYYESLKRELQTKTIYGYRCDESLKTNIKESTKIETRLTSEAPVSEMGECDLEDRCPIDVGNCCLL